jgi:Family of unknown function (DUF6220)
MKDNTISVDTTTTTSAYSGLRRGALIGYRWVLLAFLLLGVVQIFLAGVGIFGLDGQELGATGETAFNPHRSLGFGMGGLALIILILALIARPGARSIVLAVVMFLLAFLAQSLLGGLGEDTPVFGGLHALDGLAILGIAGFLYWSSRRLLTS